MEVNSDHGKYTGLHQHSVYSVLDGFGKIEDIVLRCKDLGMKGVLVSDHGNMFGAYELHEACKKHDMKPLFANEMYIAPGSALVKEKVEGFKPAYHLIAIAMNDVGFQNLMKLTSWSWLKGKYYKPRVDFERLAQWNEGIIVLSACIGGLPQQLFLEGREEEAEDAIKKFKRIFGDRYYLEMQYTGLQEQVLVNEFFRKMSEKHDIKTVITSDAHYVNKDDTDYHAALVSINTGGKITKKKESESLSNSGDTDTDESGLFYTKGEYFIKGFSDLVGHFQADPGAFATTNEIAERCNVNFKTDGKYIPFVSGIEDEDEELERVTRTYLLSFLEGKNIEGEKRAEYIERLDYELAIIKKMEFSRYFLVVSEYVQWAKNNGIMVGGGRGSAAGSLVAFCSRITNVDPIRYGLLFERFLSRGRSKMPVVEFSEFPIEKYLQEKNK